MAGIGRSYVVILRFVVADLLNTIRDIPEEALNAWKPAAAKDARDGGQPFNTFAAIAVHTVAAGEYMTLHAAGGEPSARDREAEFVATATFAEIEARFDRWLRAVEELVAGFGAEDFDRDSVAARFVERGWKRGEGLLHAIDHTGLHLGHLQIQRQLWEYERSLPG